MLVIALPSPNDEFLDALIEFASETGTVGEVPRSMARDRVVRALNGTLRIDVVERSEIFAAVVARPGGDWSYLNPHLARIVLFAPHC